MLTKLAVGVLCEVLASAAGTQQALKAVWLADRVLSGENQAEDGRDPGGPGYLHVSRGEY